MADRTLKVELLGNAKGLLSELGLVDAKAADTGGKFGKVFGAVGIGAAAGAVAVGTALFKIGESFDEQYDKIRIGTGATGAEMGKLQGTFKSVVKDVPTDFGRAGDAITQLGQRIGVGNPDLKVMSEHLLELSRITKTDLTGNIKSTEDAFSNWSIATKDQSGKLDELFRASQHSGASVSSLADTVSKAGPVARQLGFSFEQTAAMAAQMSKAGIDSDTVFAGLKKSLATMAKAGEAPAETYKRLSDEIRTSKDPIKATQEAMALFGAKAGPQMAALIREGKLSYDDMLKSISGGGDTVMKASADTQDFAEKWEKFKNRILVGLEPLASKVFNAVGTGMDRLGPILDKVVGGFRDLFSGFTKGTDAVGAAQSKWAQLGAVLYGRIAPVFKEIVLDVQLVVAAFKEGDVTSSGWHGTMEKLGNVLRNVAEFIRGHLTVVLIGLGALLLGLISPVALVVAAIVVAYEKFSWLRTGVQAVVDFFENVLIPAVEKVATYIGDQIGHLSAWWSKNWTDIRAATENVLTAIAAVVAAFIAPFVFIWQHAGDQILGVVKAAWDQIQNEISTAVRIIRDVITVAVALLSGDWGKAWDALKDIPAAALDFVVNSLRNGISLIGNVLSGAGRVIAAAAAGMFDGIKEALKAAWNWVADKWDSIQLPKVHIPGTSIDIGGGGLPQLPRFHSGGVVPGVAGSEVLAILQAGETVIPRGGAGVGRQVTVQATFHTTVNGKPDQATLDELDRRFEGHANQLARAIATA